MSEDVLTENTILVGEHLYAEALNLVISQAKNTLLIFDQDLAKGGYSEVVRFNLLQGFLSENSQNKLTIVLHYADFFNTQCPRLRQLLASYSHKMTVYITNDNAKIAKDCFVLADGQHYCRRFHIDQARFKYAFEDAETTAALAKRFDELLGETTETLSVTTLGL